MSACDLSKQIHVLNLPQGVSEDYLHLFFESERCCPLGGDTDWIRINDDGTAIVAFHDANVAQQLVSKSITFRDRLLVIRSVDPDSGQGSATTHDTDHWWEEETVDYSNSNANNSDGQHSTQVTTETLPPFTYHHVVVKLIRRLTSKRHQRLKLDAKIDFESVDSDDDSCTTVTLSGTEVQVADSKLALLQQVAMVCTKAIDLQSTSFGKFLLSKNGQKWLDKYHLDVVTYEVTGSASEVGLAATDERTLQQAERYIRENLTSREREFTDDNVQFLKSKEWADLVADLTTSKCGVESLVVTVAADFDKRRILVEGCSTAVVDETLSSITQHLKRNSDVSRPLPLPSATFELLKNYYRFAIQHEIEKNCPSEYILRPVKIDVSKDRRAFVLTGSSDAVDRAVKCIQSTFVDKICSTAVVLDGKGLSLADFTTFESEGHKSVEYWQHNWKCIITVCSEDADRDQYADDKHPMNTSTNIRITSGSLADFQADILVNLITSPKQDLMKNGRLAKAFFKAAGSLSSQLQDDLKRNWPVNFGGDVATTQGYGCGQKQARKIYHAAIRKYRNSVSYELLEDMITTCLKMAERDQLSSIAFPTLGCGGKLGYEPQSVAMCFVNAAKTCRSNLTIYIVVYADDDDMKNQFQLLLSGHAQPDGLSESPVEPSTQGSSPCSQIEVCTSSLANFKADVLVNLVTTTDTRLDKHGAIAASLVQAAGPQLQKDFESLLLPKEFGRDVAVTAATGQLQAKYVYHAAIRKYLDESSNKLLKDMICKCLQIASSDGMTSIAFPTVGCGSLRYNIFDVVECFVNAVQETGTKLKVYIVAFDDKMCQKVDAIVSALAPSGRPVPTNTRATVDGRIRFHITALDSSALTAVKARLKEEVGKMTGKQEIKVSEDQELSPELETKIKALQSATCSVSIDQRKNVVRIEGKRSDVERVKQDVSKLLYQDESFSVKIERIKTTKGTDEYLKHIGSSEGDQFPSYWNCVVNGKVTSMTEAKRVELTQSSEDYIEVEQIIMKTWEPIKVGHGNDAKNLTHKSITVKKIWRIENPKHYRAYYTQLKNICLHAATHKIPSIDGLKGEREVRTRKLGLKLHDLNVIKEINECYLIHGTKEEVVDTIVKDGADTRVAGDGAMFGKGTYMAESSTKSDQYADNPSSRVGINKPLYMFVVRALLGNPFVCQTGGAKFRRPPCATRGCSYGDGCTNSTHYRFHSVIGTHRNSTTRLIFREFIVYDPTQMYPEYLVEYERS